MKNLIIVMSRLLILSIIIFIVVAIIYGYERNHWGYTYITMENESGIAGHCYTTDKGLYCKVNGKLVSVKQYGKR